jgi:hypothetical protein
MKTPTDEVALYDKQKEVVSSQGADPYETASFLLRLNGNKQC